MLFVDFILKPIDSYWRSRCHAEAIRANKAAADLKYAEAVREDQERDLANFAACDLKQRRALDALAKEVEDLKRQLKERDVELAHTRELLLAERRASKAWAISEKLWEEKRESVMREART